MLLLDEPVNGLDPEGVRVDPPPAALARRRGPHGARVQPPDGEMALTADHLIVLGRGRLIAQTSLQDFVREAGAMQVRVRSPDGHRLAELLRHAGATIEAGDGAELVVGGVGCAAVGRTAARHGIELHELSEQRPSLEEAFMRLTADAGDYRSQPVPTEAR